MSKYPKIIIIYQWNPLKNPFGLIGNRQFSDSPGFDQDPSLFQNLFQKEPILKANGGPEAAIFYSLNNPEITLALR